MHLTLHLTTACNMRCSYCYAPPHPGPVMTFDTAVAAMDLARRTTSGSAGLVFFGGEPLLHRDLIQALVLHAREEEAKGRGRFHFKLTTNGILLDQDFIDFSLAHDVLIALSLDGIREAHDAHRRLADGGSSYDLVLPRAKMLLAARPYSSILSCVNPDTVPFLADSVAHLLELGARYLIVSLNYAADWTEKDLKALEKQYKRLGKLYVEWTEAGKKFYLSPFEVKLSSHINRHCYQKERCELAERQLSMDPDGFLYPCVQFAKAGPESDWCIGDLLSGVNEGRKARIHGRSQTEKDVCRKCAIKTRCNNTCGCLNWQTMGDINEVSPVLCRHEQMLMPIADKVGETLYKRKNALFLHKHYNSAYPVISLIEDTLAGIEEK